MIKVVISANTSWYIYNFRKNTILALIANGYSVVAVSPRDEYTKKLVDLGCYWHDIKMDQSGTNPLNDLFTCLNFYNLFKKIKPNVVLNFTPKNNIYSTISATFLKVPCINNIAGLGKVFVDKSFTSKIAEHLYRFSQHKANKVFFQNEEDRSYFVHAGLVPEKITERLNGSGIDLERFTLSPRENNKTIRFLLVARLLNQKGINEYAAAAKIITEKMCGKVEFRLLGFLDENNPNSIIKSDLEHWVSAGYINYLGISDNVELEIKQVDCMVLPSFYREGVPKSLLEGLGAGKPIITTDNIGCRETVIAGRNGFLCEPESVDSLVAAIEKFINLTVHERNEMGKVSRKLAENKFDEKLNIQRYLDAIEITLT
ncbi:MAG: glycosyltransferase involved in cell wall biosynthesis [Psychromonas sp.]|jgi:glycosyltransferase involved in cell wall biosynthesis|uniref:glycosyltransferase family 4 protein n=1 Tax=Psychromonas sp. TaxID=1884585 RepID=UPI0039E2C03B